MVLFIDLKLLFISSHTFCFPTAMLRMCEEHVPPELNKVSFIFLFIKCLLEAVNKPFLLFNVW